jgi:hypothetical protein
LETALTSAAHDIDRLRKIVENVILPAPSRLQVWKVLLEIAPQSKDEETVKFVNTQREHYFDEMRRLATVLRSGIEERCPANASSLLQAQSSTVQSILLIYLTQLFYSPSHDETASDNSTTVVEQIAPANTTGASIPIIPTTSNNNTLTLDDIEDLVHIAHVFAVVGQSNDVDSYWCFSRFLDLSRYEFGNHASFLNRQLVFLDGLLHLREATMWKHLIAVKRWS